MGSTEPRDGCVHMVSNSNWVPGTLHGAPVGALTGDFYAYMAIPQNHDRISMISVSLPKTVYLLDAQNGTFSLKVGATTYNFNINQTPWAITAGSSANTFGYGNYDSSTLLSALNNSACWDASGLPPGVWYLGTYDRKYRFVRTTGTWSAGEGIIVQNRMGRYLGFDKTTTPYVGASLGSNTLTAQYMCQLTIANVLHITCDVAQKDQPADKPNCVGVVFINETSFAAFSSVQNQPNPYESSVRLLTQEQGASVGSPNSYRLVHFSVTDDAGRIVDLNGGHMMIQLFTYQRSSLYELVRRTATSFAEVAQEQRQVNLAQLQATRSLRPPTGAESISI